VLYGLAAALGFGLSDLGAAVVSRYLGSLLALLISQVAGWILMVGILLSVGPHFSVTLQDAGFLVLNGFAAAGGFFAFYRALELGPVALVDPIATAFPLVTVVLSTVVLGEVFTGLTLVGGMVILIGVLLSSTDLRRVRVGGSQPRPGVPLAFASMFLFGVATFILGESSQRVGWLPAVLIARTALTLSVLFFYGIGRKVRPEWVQRTRQAGGQPSEWLVSLGAVGVGLLAALGDVMYARGSEIGQVSITITLSASSTLIVVAGGIFFFRERPVANQYLGIALVFGGLILLGLSA
jgi:drug/metabolite transporter (DMT)-like permease